jgi:uncharacterized phage protein (TIGR01671 family)
MNESNGKTPREILFRGKVKYNMPPHQKACDWVYGNYNKYDETSIVDSTGFAFYVIPETVREYTGLKDRNGKRIFEGDIVDIPGWGKGAVYFVDGRYGATGNKERNYPFYWLGYCKTDHSDFEAEVIGNVHDNPELLEGAKDDSE